MQDQQLEVVPAEQGGLACNSSGGVFLGGSELVVKMASQALILQFCNTILFDVLIGSPVGVNFSPVADNLALLVTTFQTTPDTPSGLGLVSKSAHAGHV